MKLNNQFLMRAWLPGVLCLLATLGALDNAAAAVSKTYTNFVTTFVDTDGNVFSEAKIIRADFDSDGSGRVVYQTNGDFNSIKLSKLTPGSLTALNIPSNHVQIARDFDRKQKEAAAKEAAAYAEEQRRLLDPANLTPMKIDAIIGKSAYDSVYGQLYSCKVRLGSRGALVTALVAKLPPDVSTYFDNVAQLQRYVADGDNRVSAGQAWVSQAQMALQQQDYQLQLAEANPSGMAPWVYAAMMQNLGVQQARSQERLQAQSVSNTVEQIEVARQQIDTVRSQLRDLESREVAATTKLVLPARHNFRGFQIYLCAPQSVQVANRRAIAGVQD